MLTVTTAATDLTLLTLSELRSATGVESGRDAELAALGRRVAAAITKACRVPADGAITPTLRLETLTETFRLKSSQGSLILSRRPSVLITSIVENDETLDTDECENHAATGMIKRLSGDSEIYWPSGKIVVVALCGWATVPDDLRLAAIKLASSYWTEGSRETGLRSFDFDVPGVYSESKSYQDKESDNPAIPYDVMQLLEAGGYVNHWIA